MPAEYPIPGGGGTARFVWDQQVAATTWVVVHPLNAKPAVTVVDTAGSVVEGDVHYDSASQITLTFSAPFSGQAYLS